MKEDNKVQVDVGCEEWKLKYVTRLVNHGLTRIEAEENYKNGDHDFDDSPEDQADDLISYYRADHG